MSQRSSKKADKSKTKPESTTSVVLVEELKGKQGVLGILTLNSEKTLNSLTLEMVNILTEHLKKWANDDTIKAVILRGAGDKAFCAGGDIQALHQSAIHPLDGICVDAENFFFHEYQLDYLIHTYDKPIICLGNGIVMGGGLGLMAGASHRIVTESSRIAMPEISIGLFPDVGSTLFLNQLPYNLGFFFALTGAQMNANDALFCHLANFAIEWKNHADLLSCLQQIDWESDNESNHLLVTSLLKEVSSQNTKLPDGNIIHNLETLEQTCRHNSLSHMLNAINQLEDDNKWLTKAKENLVKGSPFSALVIYEQLKRHLYVDLESAFISEYTLACNMVSHPDFAEGIRALLIDKDKSPNWQYKDETHIASSVIDELFKPRWETHPLEAVLRS